MRGLKVVLTAVVLGAMAGPVLATGGTADTQPGFFERTWNSLKSLFVSVKEDSKDAAHQGMAMGKEGAKRVMKAGEAVGDATVEGAKGVKKAMTTPSGDDDAAAP